MLARDGARVLLAESTTLVRFKVGETLPPAAHPLLRDLGVADSLAASGHHLACPGNVAAWGGDQLTEQSFIRDVHGPGWHLDRPRFDSQLREAAQTAGADLCTRCRLTGWEYSPAGAGWDLTLAHRGSTSRTTARWLLDATGRRAMIASRQGARSLRHDRLTAFCLVTTADSGPQDTRTFIESVADGWWYAARLPEGRRVVAFFTDDDLPAADLARTLEGFQRLFSNTRHLGPPPNPLKVVKIRRFPAASVSRTAYTGPGWIALGDATLAFDPLSSQGIFHALYTGLRGAQLALACLGGDTSAQSAWHARLGSIQAAYRRHLAQCYAAEPRWPDHPFWQRRHVLNT